jgi:hypothetical protein
LKIFRRSVLPLTVLMMVSSCSPLSTRAIEVSSKPLERQIVQPVMPREISLTNPQWIIVTPDNWEAQLERIKEQEGELVFLAMTVPDYEVMAMNMKELQRYITELKDVVVYYRKVTTTNVDQK